ncbi:adenylate/guanylate cyclase domain-containing protein [Candidatus Thalassolituus haligoni]|uniref:adenylate/guanylate cyclase domain-containing protein n=1 Tax=Candidatus Thalassolituus haligoni TaxID=3100113 RepID=UPI003514C244|tara:strand:- start:3007 stop:4479 length:1473 start_codon:yes stop_codon:yes gene_type:complete
MNDVIEGIDTAPLTHPHPDYIARILGYGTGALTIAAGIFTHYWPDNFWAAMAFCLVYPHLVEVIERRLPWSRNTALTFWTQVDAAITGLLLGLVQVPIELTLPTLLMLNTSLILTGSKSSWLSGVLISATSMFASYLWLSSGSEQAAAIPNSLVITCGAATAVFFAALALFAIRQGDQIGAMQSRLKSQIDRYQELSTQVSRYVAPQVRESIFNGKREAKLETQRKKLVIFFSDIVGFSSLSEQMEAEPLTDLLNGYLTDMSEVAMKYGGTIDKFIGDGIMIFFGDPSTKGIKRDALACVAMAIEMRRHMLKLRKHWTEQGMTTPLQIRMGINTGYCTVGNFGTESRMDYTIVGKEVNLASRLESAADAGEILISHETFSLVKDKIICRQRGTAMVKGFRDPVPLYQVVDYRRDLGANAGFMNHETEGFSLYLESEKVRDSERNKVADALEQAASKLRNQVKTRAPERQPPTAQQRAARTAAAQVKSQDK